jgi:3-isopropylmalate/(R)-2-methylmalate dehydratase large subunit
LRQLARTPLVGLVHAGVKAVLVKGVNRIFYRAAINQGLPLIVHREAVEAYRPGDAVEIDFTAGRIQIGNRAFHFEPLPRALREIIEKRGLVNWMKDAG